MRIRFCHVSIFIVYCLVVTACSSGRKTAAPAPATNAPTFVIDSALSKILGRQVPKGANPQLVKAMASWMGVPYKYGGNTQQGIDCSGLIGAILPQVYGSKPARSTAALYQQVQPVAGATLQEGDLVFFTIQTSQPGHAGIYLWNGFFLHASTSRGVIISSLHEPYWSRYFVGGGRLASRL